MGVYGKNYISGKTKQNIKALRILARDYRKIDFLSANLVYFY